METLLAAALFLTLYPFSVLLNAAHGRLRQPVARFALLLLWPQVGVLLLGLSGVAVPAGFLAWGLLTAGFYALRLLTVRDLGRYAVAQATSALALAWGMAASGAPVLAVALFVFALTLPAALMSLLDGALARRFGGAHAGLCTGLGEAVPRLAIILVLAVLAAVGTPPFPGFFALLDLLHELRGFALAGALLTWLLWGWAAVRLLQGFVAGAGRREGLHGEATDIGRAGARLWLGGLAAFSVAGLYFAGWGA